MKNNKKLVSLTFAGLFAAMITIFIYLIHIPYGNTGYIHPGDALIFLCASLLPSGYAIPAAMIGGGLADFLSGYPIYIIPTVIAKGLIAFVFSSKDEKILTKRNVISCVAAFLISLLIYAASEFIFGIAIYGLTVGGAFLTAAGTLVQNSIQAAANTALYFVLAGSLDKFKVKNKFSL